MPNARVFTQAELDCARALRRDRKGWAAIGRALSCHEDTIRAAIDPDFDNQARLARISALRRERRRAQ